MSRKTDIGAIDLAIIVTGSYGNAVTLLAAGEDLDELNIDETADVVADLANAIAERKIASFGEFSVPNRDSGGGSGNSRKSSAGSSKRASSRSGSKSRSGGGGKRPPFGGNKNGPSDKQAQFYGDLIRLLEEGDVDVAEYPSIDDFPNESFDDAKAYIGELVELRDEEGLGF